MNALGYMNTNGFHHTQITGELRAPLGERPVGHGPSAVDQCDLCLTLLRRVEQRVLDALDGHEWRVARAIHGCRTALNATAH